MHIAIEGCAHGELDSIYQCVEQLQKENNVKIELLICCGDFQSVRNENDLRCMAVPPKYYNMCSFYKYYSGECKAPVLTIFIGGNHEASNYLQELPYGGWVAPNIYYLGYAGVVNYKGLRIGGLSGIYKGHDYAKGHFELSPYTEQTKRSVYHIRNLEVFRLKQLEEGIDVFLSHDWPMEITKFGNEEQLLRFKPYFRSDIDNGKLGSPPCNELLLKLKPRYWFSAHLHCKFAALVPHDDGTRTKFLALDKCLPRKRFMQLVEIISSMSEESREINIQEEKLEVKGSKRTEDLKTNEGLTTGDDLKMAENTKTDENLRGKKTSELKTKELEAENKEIGNELSYDLEWLTILRSTQHLVSITQSTTYMPSKLGQARWDFRPSDEEKEETLKLFAYNLKIPRNFVKNAPFHQENSNEGRNIYQPEAKINSQTTEFCAKLGIMDPNEALIKASSTLDPSAPVTRVENEEEIKLDLDDDDDELAEESTSATEAVPRRARMVLPEAVHNYDEEVDGKEQMKLGEENDSKSVVGLENISMETEENSTSGKEAENGGVSGPPQAKQFKRRNASIYGEE